MKLNIVLAGVIAVCVGMILAVVLVPLPLSPVPWIIATLFAFAILLLKLIR